MVKLNDHDAPFILSSQLVQKSAEHQMLYIDSCMLSYTHNEISLFLGLDDAKSTALTCHSKRFMFMCMVTQRMFFFFKASSVQNNMLHCSLVFVLKVHYVTLNNFMSVHVSRDQTF